jgi:hypothetical protein
MKSSAYLRFRNEKVPVLKKSWRMQDSFFPDRDYYRKYNIFKFYSFSSNRTLNNNKNVWQTNNVVPKLPTIIIKKNARAYHLMISSRVKSLFANCQSPSGGNSQEWTPVGHKVAAQQVRQVRGAQPGIWTVWLMRHCYTMLKSMPANDGCTRPTFATSVRKIMYRYRYINI